MANGDRKPDMKLLKVDDVINKEGSDFKNLPPNTLNKVVLKNFCPECNSSVLCIYADLGTTEFCDTYNHICMNPVCKHMEKKIEFGISMGEREFFGPNRCPFCNRDVS